MDAFGKYRICRFNRWVSFALVFQWCFPTYSSLLSSHLYSIIGLIRDLFVPCVDSVIGWETFMGTQCYEPLQKQTVRVWIQQNLFKHPSGILLTISHNEMRVIYPVFFAQKTTL